MGNRLITTISIDGLGTARICGNSRARRIIVRRGRDGEIEATVPSDAFVQQAIDFITANRDRLSRPAAAGRRPPIVFDDCSVYRTRTFSLRIEPGSHYSQRVSATLSRGILLVRYPPAASPTDGHIQQQIRKIVTEAIRIEAKQLLPARLSRLAEQHHFVYTACTIRNTTSRWGSCSSSGHISLSLHLMRLPDELIDYVLLHELCHTVEMNHGPRFHALLDKATAGRSAALNRMLRRFSTTSLEYAGNMEE